MATETGWAIAGWCGLYTGWWMTRKEAVAAHVGAKVIANYRGGDPARAIWKQCKKEGDRAVRVKITYAAHVASKGA